MSQNITNNPMNTTTAGVTLVDAPWYGAENSRLSRGAYSIQVFYPCIRNFDLLRRFGRWHLAGLQGIVAVPAGYRGTSQVVACDAASTRMLGIFSFWRPAPDDAPSRASI